MSYKARSYIVNNISLPYNASFKEAFSIAKKKLKSMGIGTENTTMSVYRRSIDARKKNNIQFVYSIDVEGIEQPISDEKLKSHGISKNEYTEPNFDRGETKAEKPIVVVGSGPCGLFCSLLLAENGYKVKLLEKGGSIQERQNAVDLFKKTRVLDLSTNIQFGAGGAGTFSDGKLVTRINDSMTTYVLRRFVEFGAPEEIYYLAKPHIGTDILSRVVDNMLNRIEELGSEVLYHTEFLDFEETHGNIKTAITNKGKIDCSALVLAVGHSARGTYETLLKKGLDIEAKSFSVGMRIEHTTDIIDKGMFGDRAGDPLLAHGEYNLSYNTKERGVYTFCMCPGGEVVPATSEEFCTVVNGMSHHARNGRNSNSAVCCSIFKEDYGATPERAIEFQREIEKRAFIAGGSDYSAPVITVGDFLKGECKNEPTTITPTYADTMSVRLAKPETYLPKTVTDLIRRGLVDFDKKIHGFATPEAVLTGAETRTSAPIRIKRDNTTRLATGYNNLYPAGEGAGYSGGITSASIDGIRTAMQLMKVYKP